MDLHLKKIIVPTDFSETSEMAFAHAAFLARLLHAELLLVHIQAFDPYYYDIPEPLIIIQDQDKLDKYIAEKLVKMSRAVEVEYGIKPRHITSIGHVSDELIRLSQNEKADLIIMGTHGAKGFEEMIIGSNAHKIVDLAPCPVLTVQAHATKPGFSSFILPVDRSQHSRQKVPFALALAKAYGAKIHIVGLLNENDIDEEDDDNEYGKLQIILDQVQDAAEKSGVAFTRHTVKGTHLAAEALKYGKSVNADLIIIMTDHESAMSGLFMGPLAKQIVNHSTIPVLSIKPHYGNFESPDLSGGYKP